jgi:hypothetical protein
MTIFFKNKQRSVRVLPVSGSSTSALILVDTTLKATLSHPDEYVQKAKKRFWDERFLLAKPLIDRAILLLIKNARPKNVF